jgi:hypothetical protein
MIRLFDAATRGSPSPWMTKIGTATSSTPAGRRGMPCMAQNADKASCAAPKGSPEWTATAWNTSGCVAPTISAMAAPADKPATNTRLRSIAYDSLTCRAMPAMVEGSLPSRICSSRLNQFQQFWQFDDMDWAG